MTINKETSITPARLYSNILSPDTTWVQQPPYTRAIVSAATAGREPTELSFPEQTTAERWGGGGVHLSGSLAGADRKPCACVPSALSGAV